MKTDQQPLLLIQYKAESSLEETEKAVQGWLNEIRNAFQLYFVVPLSYISSLSKQFSEKGVRFGAEMMLDIASESFTKTVAIPLLKTSEASFALIGSEAEKKLYPNHDLYKDKAVAALEEKITPIVCFGESFEEHVEGKSTETIKLQLKEYETIPKEQLERFLFLYEISWLSQISLEAEQPIIQSFDQVKNLFTEIFGEDHHFKLICAVPAHTPILSKLIQSIHSDGYFFGSLYPQETISLASLVS